MKKITKWLTEKYLPSYARERLAEENARLSQDNTRLEQLLLQERAYSRGLEYSLRRKTVINIQK